MINLTETEEIKNVTVTGQLQYVIVISIYVFTNYCILNISRWVSRYIFQKIHSLSELHDVTKIQTTKLLILLTFYVNEV